MKQLQNDIKERLKTLNTDKYVKETKGAIAFRMPFLDYEIKNTWNSDGYVLHKPELDVDNLWESHLGNYSTLQEAMESAVTYFMIKRIETFRAQIHHRTLGTKTSHEWFVFKKVLEEEGIPMPKELTRSPGYTIMVALEWDEEYFKAGRY